MAYVNSDGVQIYAEESGRGGTPVVFVHEFAGDCRNWEELTFALTDPSVNISDVSNPAGEPSWKSDRLTDPPKT